MVHMILECVTASHKKYVEYTRYLNQERMPIDMTTMYTLRQYEYMKIELALPGRQEHISSSPLVTMNNGHTSI